MSAKQFAHELTSFNDKQSYTNLHQPLPPVTPPSLLVVDSYLPEGRTDAASARAAAALLRVRLAASSAHLGAGLRDGVILPRAQRTSEARVTGAQRSEQFGDCVNVGAVTRFRQFLFGDWAAVACIHFVQSSIIKWRL